MILTNLFRQSVFAAIIAAVISCGYPEKITVRPDHPHKVAIKDLCGTISVTPLCIPDSLQTLVPSKIKLDVGGEKIFILDNSALGILVFTMDGSFVSRITGCGHITDFSLYDGRSLEVLSDTGDLTSYSLDDLSILRRYHLDNVKGVQLCAMHRFDDGLYVMSGYLDGLNCFCEYYVKDNKYYVSRDEHASIAQTKNLSQIVGNSQFFDHEGKTFLFYPHSGEIWTYSYMTYSTGEKVGPFVHPMYRWDFGEFNESVNAIATGEIDFNDARLRFDNAQMSGNCLFASFILDGKHRLLILDTNARKARTVEFTKEKIRFPLGVIRGNINYFCCAETDLPDYCLPAEIQEYENSSRFYLLAYSIR